MVLLLYCIFFVGKYIIKIYMTLSRKYIVIFKCCHGYLNPNINLYIDAWNFYFRSGISLHHIRVLQDIRPLLPSETIVPAAADCLVHIVVPRVGVVPEKSDSITRSGDRPRSWCTLCCSKAKKAFVCTCD